MKSKTYSDEKIIYGIGIIGAVLFGVLISLSGCEKNDDNASGIIKDMVPHTI